ncbi:aminopeptidase P N-terminal domain-containing protein [Ktedonospora formicarum]|uniref:Xaa-Pro aminopeptidase n=1 Tax=Ktedonospora formicarum TaxID=2778364 RepID=A0A8J3I1T6_9CHLR|nr:aminopeptidase P N-terminal domain-containing protein [Ktedonospora formicarum]GHO44677.1 Xaa-Pro aminopeptidase [Ktedonospora formicarum]
MSHATKRQAFMEKMQGGVAIFRSAPEFLRSGGHNIEISYRQDSDFYYLTGFTEPETICVLAPEHPEHHFILFVRPRDPQQETWTGRRAGVEGAIETYGADAAYTLDQLDEKLPDYLKGCETLYYNSGKEHAFDEEMLTFINRFRSAMGRGPRQLVDPGSILNELRAIKDADELETMRKAAQISGNAYREVLKALKPGMYEYEIQAVLDYGYLKHGSMRHGYSPIVGSGPNATILHYDQNNRQMRDGELLLIDSGADYQYYSADITRTYPINGRFTPEQRALYEIVLEAEEACIAATAPGRDLADIHNTAVEVLTSGLVALGILQGDVHKNIEEKSYRQFYMHGTCHWLGLDVHDRGPYRVTPKGRSATLVPGMVFTIEPGLYIPENAENVDPRYRGIGIRIEDNVIVTEEGCEITTGNAPKTIEEIEAIMANS